MTNPSSLIPLRLSSYLIPLFSEVFGYKNLRHLNTTERSNYPAIDLADDVAGVAIQVTSRRDLEKVKETLRKFTDYELYKKYRTLFIYVLTEKQQTYSRGPCKTIVRDRFDFDPNRDVLDYRDFLKKIDSFQIEKTQRVQKILEANFGQEENLLPAPEDNQYTECVHLNLLELFFPPTLFVATLAIDNESVPHSRKFRRKSFRSQRKTVQDALKRRELRFRIDWECYRNQIISFHDLGDSNIPLSQVVDQGTVTPLHPDEFYGIDEDQERVFKTLLGRCLQQKLYLQNVMWQNQDKLYIFAEKAGSPTRTEQWYGKREIERVVYERVMKKKFPDQISHHKHLAFRTQYKCLGRNWYLLLKPEWFFSYDGYRRSFYGGEKIGELYT